MRVTVKFVGAFRGMSGKSKLTFELKDATPLKQVIEEIARKLPKLEKILVDPELEDSRPNMLILVNGKEISVLNGLRTKIKDGDEIVLIPVVHGG